jgi:hypothetical protein
MIIVFTVFDKFTIYNDFGSSLDYGNQWRIKPGYQ